MSGVIVRVGRGLWALLVCVGLLRSASADDIDDYVTGQMQKQHIPGVGLAVVRDGKVVKTEGYGLASLELGAPVTTASVFRIGSLTTQFTAMLTLIMAESGKLPLDAPISRYISGTPAAWSKITVRNLLNQTSGIADYKRTPQWRDAARFVTRDDLVKYVAVAPLDFELNSKSSYSSTNFFLLGLILEKVSKEPYAALLSERITIPLGMSATKVDDSSGIVPNRVSGYSHLAPTRAVRNAAFIDSSWRFASGGLISTASDLAKWDLALSTEALVKRSTFDPMAAPPALADGSPAGYAFGWRFATAKGHRLLDGRSGISGFTSELARFVDDNVTVIVLTNSDDANTESIALGVTGFYFAGLSTAALKPIADTQPQTTSLLRDIFLKIATGSGDPAVFTPEMWKLIQPSIASAAEYKSFGAIASVDLLNYEAVEALGIRTYQYRMNYERTTLVVDLVLDKAGKVSSLKIRAE